MKNLLLKDIADKSKIINSIPEKSILKICDSIFNAIKKRKNIFIIGNGGSASTADHMCCDYMKRFKNYNPKLISLCSNNSLNLAISNDKNFNNIFSEQIKAYSDNGDILIIFSVSANSLNLLNAANLAKRKKLIVISFCGNNGGKLKKKSHLSISIDSKNYGLVEDIHLSLTHLISDFVLGKQNTI